MSKRTLGLLEHLLLVAGIVLLASYALALVDGWVSSRRALRAFDQITTADTASESSGRPPRADEDVDVSLWSEKRVREYKQTLLFEKRLPWAVLEMARLRIRVPVFDGTDDVTLNRGVGWIAGTGRPGDGGNIGIAGHRDGVFRGLKDIVAGDEVVLTTAAEHARYVVDLIEIVDPERVEVLRPRASPSLTLVTCYPFYFVGDAPQRFIVHARLDRTAPTARLNPVRD
jgi:sortase A